MGRRLSFLAVLWLSLCLPTLLHADDGVVTSETPSYQRHVAALFGKLGCNGGTCHGAVQGQNGFKLSLFGADVARDHERLLREFSGRRLNFIDPEASLLLQKAAGRVTHQGGKRTEVGSFEYDVLRRWVVAGAPLDAPEPSRLRELKVQPTEKVVAVGETYQLRIDAVFGDGTTEDVTRYCSFGSMDEQVASVDGVGTVRGQGIGACTLVVRYRSTPATAAIQVPRPAGTFPEVRANNFIDDQILAKLKRLNVLPSGVADDATFLRRVYLDVAGELPTAADVREFLEDTRADKRARKIDELLTRPGHAALWTMKFCDLLKAADFGVYADALSQEADAPRFQAWIRARLDENLPYDQFVERILLATSREERSVEEYAQEVKEMMEGYAPGRKDLELYQKRKTLDLYWQRRGADGLSGALQVAHAFLGLRLECAQCHRHPHDIWQQDDLLSFANFFMRVRKVGFQGDTEKKFPERAAIAKRFNDEAKQLEAEVKKRKEGALKTADEEIKKAKQDNDKLTADLTKLTKEAEQLAEKDPKEAAVREEIKNKKQTQAQLLELIAAKEKLKSETAELEKRSKLLPEVARRFQHAEIFLLPPGSFASVTSPLGTQSSKTYRLLGEPEAVVVPEDKDPRAFVVDWMRRPDNPYFARAIVNRVWAHYFGRGLIDPPDNLSAFNPCSHPELLKQLCEDFVKNKYDLRRLHRTILQSRTYQQSNQSTKENAGDKSGYSYFALRRLPAEVLIDAIDRATGTTENLDMKYYHWPEGTKAVELPYPPRNAYITMMLESFGKPKRNSAVQCDCERDGGASIFQVLTMSNHPRIWEKIADPKGRVAQLIKEHSDETRRLDELFLAVLGRLPDDIERAGCRKYLTTADSPEKGLQGILWSLMNTREFLLQH